MNTYSEITVSLQSMATGGSCTALRSTVSPFRNRLGERAPQRFDIKDSL